MMNKYKKFSKEANKIRKKAKTCDRKKSFKTEEDAYQKGQEFYLCPYCKTYHRTGKFSNLLSIIKRKSNEYCRKNT